ncbi:PHD finger protein 20-like protein 1 isoform X3 [Ostrea edulis]|nr:PHD finger protein 20-like protein 1 isoform X3 [Ostrea edulis]
MDYSSKWYQAKIVDIDEEELMVMIHFDGWNQRYDEWILMNSEKLRPKTRHSSRKEKQKQSDFRVGDHVYAKWTDCKMYPGKVTAVYSDDSYNILFYDGFKKTVQGINIKMMPKELQQKKIEIVHVLPKDERKKSTEEEADVNLPKKRRSSSIYSRRERDSIEKPPKNVESTKRMAEKVSEKMSKSTSSDEGKRKSSTDRRRTKMDKKKLIVAGSLFKKRDRSTSSERSKTGSCSSKDLTADDMVESTGIKIEQQHVESEDAGGSTEQPPGEDSSVQATQSAERFGGKELEEETVPEASENEAMTQSSIDTATSLSVPSPGPTEQPVAGLSSTESPVATSSSAETPFSDPIITAPPVVGTSSAGPPGPPSTPVPVSAPTTPLTTPVSSMPPSPASTLSAMSSSPSTPKVSPCVKSDVASSGGPTLEPAIPTHTPRSKKEKKSRKQSFSPIGQTESGENSARKRSKSTDKGEKSDQHQSRKRSRSTNEKANYILVPETVPPPKAFVIESEHNHFKCSFENCNKAFRKESLLESHVKFYHSKEGKPPQNPPRKRRKTSSICSTDSDVSVTHRQRYPSSGSMCRPSTSTEGTTEVSGTDPLSIEGHYLSEGPKSTSVSHDVMVTEESMETEFEDTLSKDEVVNCICRFNEENGLMIQCDVCLCWQHAVCFDITENTLPKKYICFVCESPPGIRDSCTYLHDQDWLKLGHMAHFGFLLNQEEDESCCRTVQATHGLVGDLHNATAVLYGLKQKLKSARKKDKKDPMLRMWLQNLDDVHFDPLDHDADSENEEMVMDTSISMNHSKQQEDFIQEQKPELESVSHPRLKAEEDVSDSSTHNTEMKSEEQEAIPGRKEGEMNNGNLSSNIDIDTKNMDNGPDNSEADFTQKCKTEKEGTATQDESPNQNTGYSDQGLNQNTGQTDQGLGSNNGETSEENKSKPPTDVEEKTSESSKHRGHNDVAKHVISSTERAEVGTSRFTTDTSEVLATSGEGMKPVQKEESNSTITDNMDQSQSLHMKSKATANQGKDPSQSLHTEVNSTRTDNTERPHSLNTELQLGFPLEASLSSEVKVEDMCDLLNCVEVVKEDPIKHCERNLLEHILRVQTELEQRLDHIEEQVCALEAADSNFVASGPSDRDLLSDVPTLKKTLYLLQHDLVRIQRMAAYHR